MFLELFFELVDVDSSAHLRKNFNCYFQRKAQVLIKVEGSLSINIGIFFQFTKTFFQGLGKFADLSVDSIFYEPGIFFRLKIDSCVDTNNDIDQIGKSVKTGARTGEIVKLDCGAT
ncbi:MAG: hypothetical protein UX41_C0031G0009 [Candidatus Collierbacteria bacterium GW2011_GWE1_46_18]|uniref:Uncharacterized protein n=1 Tax=Candidatus Collierbacteria bacterium GW2011_GWE1_46_18 TaxID=1618399 RepID=A0A0G1P796_9BACT|nr:MAG: hypothetical protein UX41_C0031G0009 [Candidatus Collierbacteria bacterium GW2011_GWE1_46_18]